MLGAAIAYIFKKWLNYDQKKRKTAIMSLEKSMSDLNILFLTVQLPLPPSTLKNKTSLTFRNQNDRTEKIRI